MPRSTFWERVDQQTPPGCWLIPTIRKDGYCYTKRKGRNIPAHVFAWEALREPVPEGYTLDHLCRVRNCVNPDHLEPVTRRVNTLRGNTIVARRAAQTHCESGHPLAGPNLYRYPNGSRACRLCRRRWHVTHEKRKREMQC